MARQFVAEHLTAVAPELCETAALLVSELATNAIVHAASEFAVTVVYPAPSGRVRIEVTDRDLTQPAPTRPPPHVPHGRGLFLVAALADEWGVEEPRRRTGKAVWFELTPSSSPARSLAGATRWRIRRAPGRIPFLFAVTSRFPGYPPPNRTPAHQL
jgi:two-component sensor histidine kinase